MSPARRALLATVLLRIACSIFAWRFAMLIPVNPVLAGKNDHGFNLQIAGPNDGWRYLLLGIWDRFDTLWYLNIASHGYDRAPAIVFYPLYPFLIHCFNFITGDPTAAALTVSTIACFFLFWGFQKLAILDWPEQAVQALAIFAAWPTAFIFFAAYPESLVIALVVWSVYFARTDRWWVSGALACLAGFAKAAGLLVCVPLWIILLHERRWKALPSMALAPAGFISYNLWLRLSGFPSPNSVYATYWATVASLPWNTLLQACATVLRDRDWLIAMNFGGLMYCFLVLLLKKRGRLDYLLFSVACLVLFLTKHSQPVLQSSARYALFIFPVYFYTASWIKKRTTLWLVLFLLCPLYFAMLRTFLWWGLVV